jgi:hypothetical protein
MARDSELPVATRVAAGAPDEIPLTMDMVKAGLDAFDAATARSPALLVTEVFYRVLSVSNVGKLNSLCIASSSE